MAIDKKDLKIISRDFRIRANAVYNASHLQFNARVAMLINYIDAQPIIKEYMEHICVDYNPADDLNEIKKSHGCSIYNLPADEQQACSEIYQILSYISEHQEYPTYLIGRCFSSANEYDDLVGCVYTELIDFMVQEIDRYLINIATKMGFDEKSQYQIIVNGHNAQVVVAQDNSQIDAVQNNGLKLNEVSSLIEEILGIIDREVENKELAKSLKGQVEIIKCETNQPTPGYSDSLMHLVRFLSALVPEVQCTPSGTSAFHINTFYDGESFVLSALIPCRSLMEILLSIKSSYEFGTIRSMMASAIVSSSVVPMRVYQPLGSN